MNIWANVFILAFQLIAVVYGLILVRRACRYSNGVGKFIKHIGRMTEFTKEAARYHFLGMPKNSKACMKSAEEESKTCERLMGKRDS